MSSACPQNSPAKDVRSGCGILVPLKMFLLHGAGGTRTATFPNIWMEALSFGWGLAFVAGPSGTWGGFGAQSGHFPDVTLHVFGGGGGGDLLVNQAATAWQVRVNSARNDDVRNSNICRACILCQTRCQILYIH